MLQPTETKSYFHKKTLTTFSKIVFIIDVHVSFSSVLRYTNGFMNPWYLNDIVKTHKSFTTAKYLVIRWKHHNIRTFQILSWPNYVLKKYFFKCSHCCKSRPISFVPAFFTVGLWCTATKFDILRRDSAVYEQALGAVVYKAALLSRARLDSPEIQNHQINQNHQISSSGGV